MQNLLTKFKAQALLITNKTDIRHHTEFNGSFGILLVLKNTAYLLTDPRYENAKNLESDKLSVVISSDIKKDLMKIKNKHKLQSIAFQSSELNYDTYLGYKKIFKGCKFIRDKNLISKLREIKTESHIQKIKQAQKINELVLETVRKEFKIGVSEKQIANEIKITALKHGVDGFSFEPIVAFGKNSANIHHSPTTNKLKAGDVILIDMGVCVNGYQSDMSRTFISQNASEQIKSDYKKVLESFTHGIKNSKKNKAIKQLDQECREILKPDDFAHSLGHGLGLEVHELPYLSKKSKSKLEKNMVITIEPGIYRSNKYGIRIEDVVVVGSENGKSVSNFPSDISQVIWE